MGDTKGNWKKVLWYDETEIELFGHQTRSCMVDIKHCTSPQTHYPHHEAGMWGCFWAAARQWPEAHSDSCIEKVLKSTRSVLEWLSQRPDLSPIENLWLDMKRPVHTWSPWNLTELEQFFKEEWSKIVVSRCEGLIQPHRQGGEYLCSRIFYIIYFHLIDITLWKLVFILTLNSFGVFFGQQAKLYWPWFNLWKQ